MVEPCFKTTCRCVKSMFQCRPFVLKCLSWLSSGNFFRGGQNLLLCKFLLLCYCFRTKFQGGAKVSGGKLPQEAPPCGRTPEKKQIKSSLFWGAPRTTSISYFAGGGAPPPSHYYSAEVCTSK